MRVRQAKALAPMIAVAIVAAQAASAQPVPPPPPSPTTPPQPTHAQLLDLTAPVALYPDELLSDILTAAESPAQVVMADRLVSDPGSKAEDGQALFDLVQLQAWDPAVKSLTAFPQVLRMMDTHLDWTEAVGRAFAADPAAAMDAVQDLRHRALAAGALRSTADQIVSVDGPTISINPAEPARVAYPAYDPGVVYGPWPEADPPPYAFNDIHDGCAPGYFGTCWFDLAIVAPLWGWNHWDWGHHRFIRDPDRYGALTHPGGVWSATSGSRWRERQGQWNAGQVPGPRPAAVSPSPQPGLAPRLPRPQTYPGVQPAPAFQARPMIAPVPLRRVNAVQPAPLPSTAYRGQPAAPMVAPVTRTAPPPPSSPQRAPRG